MTASTTEPNMTTIVDLSSEVLIDRSQVREPYVRLLLAAFGQELVKGSRWIVIHKAVAAAYEPLLPFIAKQPLQIAA
jgi:hypothetical protein